MHSTKFLLNLLHFYAIFHFSFCSLSFSFSISWKRLIEIITKNWCQKALNILSLSSARYFLAFKVNERMNGDDDKIFRWSRLELDIIWVKVVGVTGTIEIHLFRVTEKKSQSGWNVNHAFFLSFFLSFFLFL